jgi:hypothetical protein
MKHRTRFLYVAGTVAKEEPVTELAEGRELPTTQG